MKKSLLAVFSLVAIMSCQKIDPQYIGPAGQQDSNVLTEDVMLVLGRVSDPQVSPDGQFILYGVSYTDVAANRSCRNLKVYSIAEGRIVAETKSGKSLNNARWSEDGKAVFYLQGGQLYKATFNGTTFGRGRKLSNVPAGIGEFKLCPDGQILYVSTVKSHVDKPVNIYDDLDKANAYVTSTLMYRHWDHWVEEIPHTFLAKLSDGTITPDNSKDLLEGEAGLYELPTEPFGGLEEVECNGPEIVYSCRKVEGREYAFSTATKIYLYRSGACQQLTFKGGYDTCPTFSPDGSKIAFLSMERNGYEADKVRLMLLDRSTNKAVDLTADFAYNVDSYTWHEGLIYFSSCVEALTGIFVCNPETGEIKRLTDENLQYDFGTPFHITDEYLYTTWMSMSFPTELIRINRATGAIEEISKENDHILAGLKDVTYEKRMVKTVDGKEMLTWVVLPPDFDASKTYPAIEILLGGPQGTLSQGWSYRWNYRLMASHGYVVVLPNRRGTTAFGQPWCEQISGDYPGLNMQDYLAAANMIKAEPYVGKIAACGASYGGYSVYNMCGIHGNTYDCFIAHAGIFNQEHMYMSTEEMWFPNFDNGGLHEAEYTEGELGPKGDGQTFGGIRQGGSPWSNKPEAVRHYKESPHKKVLKWHTPLLVIHGGMDFRVPLEQGMAAFNAAQMMGVESKLIVFPEENHWILKPQNALFWHREYFDWLDKHCK